MIKNCLQCKNEFNARRSNYKFCSEKCYHDLRKVKQKIRLSKICFQCNSQFNASASFRKFCSKKCGLDSHLFWNIATDEQKLNRIKKLYENLVIKQEGCWRWKGRLNHWGYGMLTIHKKNERAHRISWLIYKGEIPKGLLVCHSCDNPICSNPEHLWLGTNYDNQQDSIKKGRKNTLKKEEGNNVKKEDIIKQSQNN